jgi:transcriptional repressor NrdR
VHNLPLTIVKRDGRRESFSAQKLERSLRTACAKRPLEIAALSKIVVDVESALHRSGKAEIDSRMVGEMVIEQLRQIDRVAYIRFASVYRDFQDITTFAREIEALEDDKAVETNGINQLLLIPDDDAQLQARRPGGSGHSAQPHPALEKQT